MSQETIFFWERKHVGVIQAEPSGARLELKMLRRWEIPEDHAEPAKWGSWLKERCAEANLKGGKVRLVLSRDLLVTRRIEVPDAPDDELHQLVQFQAAAKLSTPVDQLVFDYVPLSAAGSGQPRPVFVVAIANKQLNLMRDALQAVDFEVEHVQTSFAGLAELERFAPTDLAALDSTERCMIVNNSSGYLELSLFSDRYIHFSHSQKLQEDIPEQYAKTIANEFRRAGVALNETKAAARILAFVKEDQIAAMQAALPASINESTHLITLESHPNIRFRDDVDSGLWPNLLPAIGIALGSAKSKLEPLDLLHPRQPIEKQDYRRAKVLAGVGLAAIVLMGAYLAWNMRLSSLKETVVEKTRKREQLKELIEAGQPKLEQHNLIEAWQQGQRDPLERIANLAKLSPGQSRLYLDKFLMQSTSNDSTFVVQTTGHAKTREDVEIFFDQLSEAGYKVPPKEIPRLNIDGEYPYRFDLSASWDPVAIEKQKEAEEKAAKRAAEKEKSPS